MVHAGNAIDWLLVAALAWPHVLYAAVWLHPTYWLRLFPKQGVWAFSQAALLGKVSQFATAILWFLASSPKHALDVSLISLPQWLAFLGLVGLGQVLNGAIYKAIGVDGVYYGFKLNHPVPWCTSFPFNVVSHPQYVGSVSTVLGITALLWTQGAPGLGSVAAYWCSLYAITALQEQYL